MSFDALLERPAYGIPRAEKDALLLDSLREMTAHHRRACPEYARILEGMWNGGGPAPTLADLPFLPVSLFKARTMRSVPETEVRMTMTSSGTTGQTVSRIAVDAETSLRQQRALMHSVRHVLGPKRLPMLVIDTAGVVRDPALMSARGAGVMGMMRFGRDHAFALDGDLKPDLRAIRAFLEAHGDGPFFMFGFTFLVWVRFAEALAEAGLDLSHGILLHSGGWKSMVERAVDNAVFRDRLAAWLNLTAVHNFYGMVEQLGSILLEGPDGRLYPPNVSQVVVRDPDTLEPLPDGEAGLVQVLSAIPLSYPGHSLLTEDLGVIEASDPGDGWMGAGLRILGRVPKADLRGCSDALARAA